MKHTLYTDNIKLTAVDETFLDKKLSRLDKHVPIPYTCHVTVQRDAHHRSGDIITCKISIMSGKKTFHVERTASTVQDSLDEAIGALSSELQKNHDKNKEVS